MAWGVLAYRRMEGNVRCGCGGILRGLSPGERCRGCGMLVAESPWHLVWNAEKRWLMTLKDGVVWLTFGHMMMWVVTIVLMAGLNFVGEWPPRWLIMLPEVPLLLGAWLVAEENPIGERRVERFVAGMVRVMVVFYGVASVVVWTWDCGWEYQELFLQWHLMRVGCWAGLVTMLGWRAIHMAKQMEQLGLVVYGWFAIMFAGMGAVLSNVPLLVAAMEWNRDPGWFADWLLKVVEIGQGWDVMGRGILFLLAVVFWWQINLALRRLSWRRGVCFTREGMKMEERAGRSVWGRLVAEAEGRSGSGWGCDYSPH